MSENEHENEIVCMNEENISETMHQINDETKVII